MTSEEQIVSAEHEAKRRGEKFRRSLTRWRFYNDKPYFSHHKFEWTSVVDKHLCVCGHTIDDHGYPDWKCARLDGFPCLCRSFEQIKAVPVGATEKELREILIKALEAKIEKSFERKCGFTPIPLPTPRIRKVSYWDFFPL